MSRSLFSDPRYALQRPSILCFLVVLSQSAGAQLVETPGSMPTVMEVSVAPNGDVPVTGESAATTLTPFLVADNGASTFDLLGPEDFSESFGTAGFDYEEVPLAAVPLTDIALLGLNAAVEAQTKIDAAASSQGKPNKPSLEDLGFPPDLLKGSAEDQALLDKRSHMLKIHQRLGLITLVPMAATIFTSGGASGKSGSASGRNLHGALGLVTAAMYVTTASYAIRAPKLPGTETRGPIRLHKILAWVHGARMILTPILGAMARTQLDRGEKVHGVAAAHSAVADVTLAAYAAAIASVSFKY